MSIRSSPIVAYFRLFHGGGGVVGGWLCCDRRCGGLSPSSLRLFTLICFSARLFTAAAGMFSGAASVADFVNRFFY